MLYVLLFIASLFALIASLLCERKLTAAAVVICAFGVVYFAWGVINTFGVPDELIRPDDTTRIWAGVALVVIGGIMAGIRWITAVRSEMPGPR